jgi:hypothetical protein
VLPRNTNKVKGAAIIHAFVNAYVILNKILASLLRWNSRMCLHLALGIIVNVYAKRIQVIVGIKPVFYTDLS